MNFIDTPNYAGRHLIIDGVFSSDKVKDMSSREFLSDYLEEVTKITNMTLVFPPIAMSFPFSGEAVRLLEKLDAEGKCNDSEILSSFRTHINQRNTLGSGVSAIAIWVESHCTLHSWTEKNYISIDLFSCSDYEIQPVIEYTNKVMGFEKASFIVVDRMMDGSLPVIEKFTLNSSTGTLFCAE